MLVPDQRWSCMRRGLIPPPAHGLTLGVARRKAIWCRDIGLPIATARRAGSKTAKPQQPSRSVSLHES
jgi:hypothetical protein